MKEKGFITIGLIFTIIALISLVTTVIVVETIMEKEKYNITFEPNGGTVLTSAQVVEQGEKVLEPAEPSKEGHTFQGWYEGDTKYDFDKEVNKDIILTAKWKKNNYKITLSCFQITIYQADQ